MAGSAAAGRAAGSAAAREREHEIVTAHGRNAFTTQSTDGTQFTGRDSVCWLFDNRKFAFDLLTRLETYAARKRGCNLIETG